jgi:SAM-dependent methyltransferase
MENAIFISDPLDLKYFYNSKFDRLYFGNEFSVKYLPSKKQLENIIDFCKKNEISLTFVTPFFKDVDFSIIENLLDILPKKTEVVFNDFGLLNYLNEKNFLPLHGRLLMSVKRDPRLNKNSSKYFKTTNFSSFYYKILLENNVARIELDNVKQGFDFEANKQIESSLYYPYVYSTVSLENYSNEKRSKHKIDSSDVFVENNVQYYINKNKPTNLRKSGVNRLVYMPVFPNHNSLSDNEAYLNWRFIYNTDSERNWANNLDNYVEPIIKKALLSEPTSILDIGCGDGSKSSLFPEKINYTGIDISKKGISLAVKLYPDRTFLQSDFFDFTSDKKFDLIFDFGFMHTLPRWKLENYFSKIYSLLSNKGNLILVSRFSESNNSMPSKFISNQLPEWSVGFDQIKKLILNKFIIKEKYVKSFIKDTDFIYFLFEKLD